MQKPCDEFSWHKPWVLGFLVVVLFAVAYTEAARGQAAPAPASAPASAPGRNGSETISEAEVKRVDAIKRRFDEAMGKPLAERVPLLEALDASLAAELLSGKLSGKDRVEGLYYRYNAQMQIARFPEAFTTYAAYVGSMRREVNVKRAYHSFAYGLDAWERRGDYTSMLEASKAVAERLAEAPEIKAMALYHQARAHYRLNGTLDECIEVCWRLIEEFPESEWRPKAMKMLAHAQHGTGKHKESLATLELLKAQYPDTQYEHYAAMRPAAFWEVRGEAQQALSIYQKALEAYPDQVYGPYIHQEIARLQKVVEDQLIQDALDGLTRKDDDQEPGAGQTPAEVKAIDGPVGAAPPESPESPGTAEEAGVPVDAEAPETAERGDDPGTAETLGEAGESVVLR